MTNETKPTLTARALRLITKAAYIAAVHALAVVGLWYVGTTLALKQYGLTIEKAQQIRDIGDILFESPQAQFDAAPAPKLKP